MRPGFKSALVVSVVSLFAFEAHAQAPAGGTAPQQSAAPAAKVEELPQVEVVQEAPAQKAARAKKNAVAVSPLTSTASTGTPASSGTQQVGNVVVTTALPTVPSGVSTVTDTEIEREGTSSIQQALQQQVPSVILSDAAGNPVRAEVSYRGFDASPVSGRAQGLAVYQNGVRINEAFGDVVNWDVMPSNAIAGISVVSNNPSFGLNALGGAASILMKDGFSYQGAEADVMAGSFGRRQIGLQAGAASGNAAVYAAIERIEEEGFRNFSPTDVKRFYGDIGLKGTFAEIHFNLTAADNHFGATAAAPVELLAESWSNTFTSPQTQDIEAFMPTLSGSVKASNTLTLSGVGYFRRYKQDVVDGNVTEADECTADNGNAALPGGKKNKKYLCLDEGEGNPLLNAATGMPINVSMLGLDEPFGTIDRLNTSSRSWGGVVEAREKAPLLGRPNLFIAGLSYDHGTTNYKTSSELGTIGPQYVVEGSGVFVRDEENEVSPRDLDAENTYWGLYFSDALEVTDRLTVTLGGRFNHARIELTDNTTDFPELNSTNTYSRFNPMAGANFKVSKSVSIYGGYSESNRAPTPAELGCAEPDNPCLIESFLTDDPPLKQVVGRTAEVGVRGQGMYFGGAVTWSAGLFRTLASDDILPVTVVGNSNRVYFVNAGDTLRQGVELASTYETRNWSVYGSYAFIDATLDTCNDPSGECAFLQAGDRLPGIPRHRFKAGFDYWITSKWRFGADLIAASNSPLFPNAAKADADADGISSFLGGYTRVDLHTSYDVTKNVQVYGLIKNLFDQRYGLYGTYFETDEVSEINKQLNGFPLEDPRTISPSMPFAAYGGVKIHY
jgi:outer membrane receptor protein involved in Fe transport